MDYKTACKKRDIIYKNHAVLNYHIDYPVFGNSLMAGRINRVTNAQVSKIVKTAESIQYKNACKRYNILGKQNNFTHTNVSGNFQISSQTDMLLSWFIDYHVDMGEDGKHSERMSQNWDMTNGALMSLEGLFYRNTNWLARCIVLMEEGVEGLENEMGTHCNPDWREYALQSIKKGRFYLTDDGIAIWFKYGTVAAGIWGMPTVHIRFSDLNGVINKKYFGN